MVGRTLAPQHRSPIHQPLSVLLVPALILMSPFSKRQKEWWGLTHLVAHATAGNQQPEDMCGTTCLTGAGVKVGKSRAHCHQEGPSSLTCPGAPLPRCRHQREPRC